MSLFFFTIIQEKVFWKVTDVPVSVTEIAEKARLPRTSVAKALDKLESLGLVASRKVRDKNRHLYVRSSKEEIQKIVDGFKASLFEKGEVKEKNFSLHNEESTSMYYGKESIFSVVSEMIELRKNERLYIVQGKDAPLSWVTFLGEKDILEIHKITKENEVIIVSLRGDSFKKEILDRASLKKSYEGRVSSTFSMPDEFFEEKTSLYATRGFVLFINLKKEYAFKIEDKALSAVVIKLLQFILKKTNRD